MTLYNLIKQYTNGSEESMWQSVKTISDFLDNKLSEDDKDCLNRCIYGIMSKGHYNETFAKEDIDKMTVSGKQSLPINFFTLEQAEELFKEYHRGSFVESYNEYDFWVTLNMILTDNIELIRNWFPQEGTDELNKRIYTMAVNWLNDNDNPFGTSKIWCYFNSKI